MKLGIRDPNETPASRFIHDRLIDPEFYPDASSEKRATIAKSLADKLTHEGHLQAAEEDLSTQFFQVSTPMHIEMQASGEGDLLVFKNAKLAKVETNKNQDEILEEGLHELAATIGGRPIDIEHNKSENCGVYTAGRAGEDHYLYVDGFIWADRYPQIAQGIQAGTHGLSVDALAAKARCSLCEREFVAAQQYCEHILNRKSLGSRRTLIGLKAKGGAVTAKPAGTGTNFDSAHIYFVASHDEHALEGSWYDKHLKEGETIDDLPASDFADSKGRRFPYKIHGKVVEEGWQAAWSAAHGGHTGKTDSSAIAKLKRDKPKGVEISESLEEKDMNCPHCGKEGGEGAKCSACGKSMQASVIASELADALSKLQALTAEKTELVAASNQFEAAITKAKADVEASKTELQTVKLQSTMVARRVILAAMKDEDWDKAKETISKMDEPTFDLFSKSLTGGIALTASTSGPAGLRMPDQSLAAGSKTALTLK